MQWFALRTSNDDAAKLASLKFLGHWIGDIQGGQTIFKRSRCRRGDIGLAPAFRSHARLVDTLAVDCREVTRVARVHGPGGLLTHIVILIEWATLPARPRSGRGAAGEPD